MEIRPILKEKLFYFYEDFLKDIETSLKNLGKIDWMLQMNSAQSIPGNPIKKDGNVPILDLHQNLDFNTQLLTQEIFDDLGAALNCFIVGYFKQTQSLLRNSVELIIQLWSNKNSLESKWVRGLRGIEKINYATKEIEKSEKEIPEIKGIIRKADKLYGRLCMSSHSHKRRMNSMNSPRSRSTLDGQIFEPFEVLYTKRIFIYTLSLMLDLLILFFENQKNTDLKLQIIKVLEEEKIRLQKKYLKQIQFFDKGFLIFRERLVINSEKKIDLFSIDLEGDYKEVGKIKTRLKKSEQKDFRKALKLRYLND